MARRRWKEETTRKNNFLSVLLGFGAYVILSFPLLSTPAAQTWIEQSATGTPPAARYSAGNAYDGVNDRLIRFSGAKTAPGTLAESDAAGLARVSETYGELPLSFEANQGQADAQVQFLARGPGYGLFLTSTEAVLVLRKPQGHQSAISGQPAAKLERNEKTNTTVLRITLVGANPLPQLRGLDELPGKSHYFLGNDPTKWRTNIPNYAKVQYQDVYPGVDLVYYGTQGQLKYDLVVGPGADPGVITLGFQGVDELEIDVQGELILHTPGGAVRQHVPTIYQTTDGVRTLVSGHYVQKRKDRIGVQVATYDTKKPLIIDPALSYSTHLGGSGTDVGRGIAVDASGAAYLTGYTSSPGVFPSSISFPTQNALQGTRRGTWDAFVTKLNPTGSALDYSTYLGGTGDDFGTAIAVDALGNAYVTGYTNSSDFPRAGTPYQGANAGGTDAFVTQLNPTGSALVYSTYLGGSGNDAGHGIAVHASGNAYVTGETDSPDFPRAGTPYQGANAGGTDAFVTQLNAQGSALTYSSYFGGSGADVGRGIAVDASGAAYVTGYTSSTNFPKVNALQGYGGGYDAFVLKLSPVGTIKNIEQFLETCPTNDPAYVQIRSDFAIRRNGVAVGAIPCSEPVSQMPLSQYTDELIVLQGLRVIYYMDRGRSGHLPWTSGTLYAWMKSEIGGIDISDTATNSYCCVQYGGREYIVVNAQDAFNRDFDRSWEGISGNIALYAHEIRHLEIFGHVSCCGTPQGCDLTYDESNLSPYGIQWWLNENWLTGDLYVGFSCLDPTRVQEIAVWHLIACNLAFRDRFCQNKPPVLTMPQSPGGQCRPVMTLTYSTYLGGSSDDAGFGIAVDGGEKAYVTGSTGSPDFPRAGTPYQGANAGGGDAFVTKLNATGSALVYSTYLGGSVGDAGFGIAVDALGNAYITGYTNSTNFPTVNPLQGLNAGGSDVFVTKLNATGSALVYSTYLGGGNADGGSAITLDTNGNAYVTGSTYSNPLVPTNFPTVNPVQGLNAGFDDAFVTKIVSGPDLTGAWLGLTQTCRTIRGALEVLCRLHGTFLVRNQGTEHAASSVLSFYLSSDGTLDDPNLTFLQQAAIGPLNMGQTRRVILNSGPGDSASGAFVIATVDADNTVAETNETNNVIVVGPVR